MIPVMFCKEPAGPVLGFTAAIAAYGAYYASCLLVNWWFYARKNAEIPC